MINCSIYIIDGRAISQLHASRTIIRGAKERFAHLMHTAFGQSANTKDLTFVQIQRHIIKLSGHRDIFHRNGNVSCKRCAPIGAVVLPVHLTTYHEGLELFNVDLVFLHRAYKISITQNGDLVGHRHDDIHVMVDHDHTVPLITHTVDDLEQLVAAILRKRCRCLIDNENLRVEPRGFDYLNELALLECIVLNRVRRLDIVKTVRI